MSRILELREKVKKFDRTIVLPESGDSRILKGADFLVSEKMVKVVLLGKEESVYKKASEIGLGLKGVEIIDPENFSRRNEVIEAFYQRRKHKGITISDAEREIMADHTKYAAMMVHANMADGFVAGATHTTSAVARAAIQCLRVDRKIGTVSSSFLMEIGNKSYGEDGLFAYGDCGIVPYPNHRQLAGIAIATSDIIRELFEVTPRVAFLSYSTKGSAKSSSSEMIRKAMEKINEKRPDLLVDGELQLDAAIVPEVAQLKCPQSKVAGRANVLIFPNLDAGNIAYKLSQRLGNARAVGPILQGLDRPCSDLSRGCSWEDVVDTASVIAIRAEADSASRD